MLEFRGCEPGRTGMCVEFVRIRKIVFPRVSARCVAPGATVLAPAFL